MRPTAPQAVGPGSAAADELTAAVEGAQRGDSESFRILYREAQPRLLRYLSYLVGSEAEDIASETWLQAARDLGKFHGSHGDFRGWLTTIARNRAMDYLRYAKRQPPAVPVPVEDLTFVAGRDDTEDRAIEAISTEQAISLIASLPRDQAEAVLLRAVVGLDAKTAAQVVGKRAGAVRTAAYRGLKNIEKRLQAQPDRPDRWSGRLPAARLTAAPPLAPPRAKFLLNGRWFHPHPTPERKKRWTGGTTLPFC